MSAPEPPLLTDPPAPHAAHSAASPLWRGVAGAVLIFLATRLVVWTAAYSGALVDLRIAQGLGPPLEQHRRQLAQIRSAPDSELAAAYRTCIGNFAPLLRWDAGHYASIAAQGYCYTRPPPDAPLAEAQSNIAFFPLYPLMGRALAPLLGVPGALVLVANAAGLVAAVLVYLGTRRRCDGPTALLAVALVFCWPPACFYSFGYAESVMLALTAATLLLADRGAYWAAALTCALATAARPSGVALTLVLMLAHWFAADGPRLRRALRTLAIGLVGSLGLLAYAAYLAQRFGSALVYLDSLRSGWVPPMSGRDWLAFALLARIWDQLKYLGRTFAALPGSLITLADPLLWNIPATLAVLALSLWGLARAPRRFRPWLLLGPLIFLQAYVGAGWSSFGVESLGRYTMLGLPAFIVLAAWMTGKWGAAARTTLIAALLLIEVAWAFQFGLGEWAG